MYRALIVTIVLSLATSANCQINILDYHDTDAAAGSPAQPTANFVRDAAAAIGANLTVVGTLPAFKTTFDAGIGTYDVVIVSSWSGIAGTCDIDTGLLDRLESQDAGGGRSILNAWHLMNFTGHPIFTSAMPATFSSAYTTPIPLNSWDPMHPIWTTPNPVGSPIPIGMTYTYNTDGQYADAGPGGVAVGGYGGASPTPTNAGIIIGPRGSILNTFTPQQYDMASMVDLLVNEILYNASLVTCAIGSPTTGATVSGPVTVTFDGDDTESDPITSTLEWSTDAGVSWGPATMTVTSPLANPDLMRATPFLGASFEWDSAVDGVGLFAPQATELRISVTDGTHNGRCTVSVMVDNVVPPPTCTLTMPPGTLTGDIDIDVDTASPSSPTVDAILEFSEDGGATWNPCTMAAASPNPNPGMGLAVGLARFVWDSRGDGVALAALLPAVIVRASIDDGVAFITGTCQDVRDIDNTQICNGLCGDCDLNGQGPNIVDALQAAQIAAALIVPTVTQTACCDVDASGTVNVIDALFIAQSAAGLPATLTCL